MSCIRGGITNPVHQYRLEDDLLGRRSAEKDVGVQVDGWSWTSSVSLRPRPVVSWAALGRVWPAVWGRWPPPPHVEPHLEYCMYLWAPWYRTWSFHEDIYDSSNSQSWHSGQGPDLKPKLKGWEDLQFRLSYSRHERFTAKYEDKLCLKPSGSMISCQSSLISARKCEK